MPDQKLLNFYEKIIHAPLRTDRQRKAVALSMGTLFFDVKPSTGQCFVRSEESKAPVADSIHEGLEMLGADQLVWVSITI